MLAAKGQGRPSTLCQVEVPLLCQLPLSVHQGSSLLASPLHCQLQPSGNLLEIFSALILTELI